MVEALLFAEHEGRQVFERIQGLRGVGLRIREISFDDHYLREIHTHLQAASKVCVCMCMYVYVCVCAFVRAGVLELCEDMP